jgi:cytochrome c553
MQSRVYLYVLVLLSHGLFFSKLALAETTKIQPDPQAGSTAYTNAGCIACHGVDGNSSIAQNPKLAGQHADYLISQLQAYKSGERENSIIMYGFASNLSIEQMQNIAAWLEIQPPALGIAGGSEEAIQLGEHMYRIGMKDRNIPACAGCHSPSGVGIPKQYPRLAGQHSAYTEAQLKAFRNGNRIGVLPMHSVAKYMTDEEIKAVSIYTEGLR